MALHTKEDGGDLRQIGEWLRALDYVTFFRSSEMMLLTNCKQRRVAQREHNMQRMQPHQPACLAIVYKRE